jgi:hypothetical protein
MEPVSRTWRGEKSYHYRDSNSDPSAIQPIASRYPGSPIVTKVATASNLSALCTCTRMRTQDAEVQAAHMRTVCTGVGSTLRNLVAEA